MPTYVYVVVRYYGPVGDLGIVSVHRTLESAEDQASNLNIQNGVENHFVEEYELS